MRNFGSESLLKLVVSRPRNFLQLHVFIDLAYWKSKSGSFPNIVFSFK